jgi:hypothetical protein
MYYGGLAHMQFIGLKFATSAANFCLSFYGQDDGGILVDDCEFSGFTVAGIALVGGYSPSWTGNFIHGCHANNTASTYLARLNGNFGTRIRGCSLAVGGLEWQDYGGNSGTVVD